MSHHCEYCTSDEEGNPEVCGGPPPDEPDWVHLDAEERESTPLPPITFIDGPPF